MRHKHSKRHKHNNIPSRALPAIQPPPPPAPSNQPTHTHLLPASRLVCAHALVERGLAGYGFRWSNLPHPLSPPPLPLLWLPFSPPLPPRIRHTHLHTHTHTHTHTHAHAHIDTCCIYIYITYICRCACVSVCVCLYACVHTYVHTYIHTHIHTYIHTYILLNICVPARRTRSY